MPNGSPNWLVGLAGAICGTVLGGLILKGFVTVAVAERLKSLEAGQQEIKDRILRMEALALERLARIEEHTAVLKRQQDGSA